MTDDNSPATTVYQLESQNYAINGQRYTFGIYASLEGAQAAYQALDRDGKPVNLIWDEMTYGWLAQLPNDGINLFITPSTLQP